MIDMIPVRPCTTPETDMTSHSYPSTEGLIREFNHLRTMTIGDAVYNFWATHGTSRVKVTTIANRPNSSVDKERQLVCCEVGFKPTATKLLSLTEYTHPNHQGIGLVESVYQVLTCHGYSIEKSHSKTC
jgi:hypothetical protein